MNKLQQQQVTSGELLVCALLELIIVRIAYRIDQSKTIPMLSTAAWAIILGILFGFLLSSFSQERVRDIGLDPQVIFLGLIPPIILEAGYMTQHRGFFANFWDIFLLGIVGTILSTMLIGAILYVLSGPRIFGITLTSDEAVLYGSLISAIDPIATQLVLRKSHVPSLIPELVFGERSLNNAISVVVFMLCQWRVLLGEDFSYIVAINMCLELIAVCFGSLVLASIVGFASAFILRHTDDSLKQHPEYEISVLLLFAYACYLGGEACHLSGHLCVFFTGVFMRHYHIHNISKASATTFKHLLRSLAFLAENFIFIYLGVSAFAYSDALEWNWSFNVISFVICLAVRAITTFLLCIIAGLWRMHPIPVQYMIVIWFSGLRGAISFALSLTVQSSHGAIFRSSTLCTVLVTTIGFTLGMGLLIRILRLAHTCDEHHHLRQGGEEQQPIVLSSSEEEEATWIRDAWNEFDQRHLQPYFGQVEATGN